MDYNFDEKMAELCQLFIDAEAAIKEIEISDKEISIPALNELRYAGAHLVKIFGKKNIVLEEKKDNIDRAICHCKRAIYDAFECGIINCLDAIDAFTEDYKKTCVSNVIPEICQDKLKINEVQSRLSKNGFHEDNREELYREKKDDFSSLKGIAAKFEIAREELNKKIRAENRQTWYSRLVLYITFLTAIIGVVTCFKPEIKNFFADNGKIQGATKQSIDNSTH